MLKQYGQYGYCGKVLYSFAHIKSLSAKKPVRRMSSPEMLLLITDSGIKSKEYDEFNRFFGLKSFPPYFNFKTGAWAPPSCHRD